MNTFDIVLSITYTVAKVVLLSHFMSITHQMFVLENFKILQMCVFICYAYARKNCYIEVLFDATKWRAVGQNLATIEYQCPKALPAKCEWSLRKSMNVKYPFVELIP